MRTTEQLVKTLRGWGCAYEIDPAHQTLSRDLKEAADRLEALEERVAIMAESMDEQWGNSFG